MKSVFVCILTVVTISVSSCGTFDKNEAKITALHKQIEAVNKDLAELNNSFVSLNTNLDVARKKLEQSDQWLAAKKEEERKQQIQAQMAYVQQLQTDIRQVKEQINEKQERYAMLNTEMAKLE